MACTHYLFDAKSSQVTVQAFAEGLAGIAEHRPRFSVRNFSGEVEFSPEKREDGSLVFTARAESLEIMDEVTKSELREIMRVMFDEILHPQEFPEIVFRSSQVSSYSVLQKRYSTDITGTIWLHGVDGPQSIQAQVVLSEGSLRAYGEFRLRQTDYGLAIASVLRGALRIKDELKFGFFVVAREAKD